MTIREEGEKAAEEMADQVSQACGEIARSANVASEGVRSLGDALTVTAGLDSDPLHEAPSLPWHARLRIALGFKVRP